MTSNLGAYPPGWTVTKFREFLTPNSRPYTLGADEDADLVGMRWYGLGPFHRERKQAIKILKKTHFVIRTGDVIYNKLFAWRGSFGIVPEELDGMYVSDKFPTYALDEAQVDPGFLGWLFRSPGLWEQARRVSTGSAALSKLTLNPPRFLDLAVDLPSLELQREISSRLDSLSHSIAKATALMDSVEPQADALLLAGIDKAYQKLGDRYGVIPLTGIVEESRGISYGVVQTGQPYEGGIPTLRAGDLRPFEVLLSNVKRVDPSIESGYQRTRLEGREVLLRIRGGLGEVAVCPPEMIGGNVSREIAVIPISAEMIPEFVMYAIAAPSIQRFLRSNLRGTSYVGINLKDVRRVEIPDVPQPEQIETVRKLDSLRSKVEELEQWQSEAAMATGALLPSYLDRILRPAHEGAERPTQEG